MSAYSASSTNLQALRELDNEVRACCELSSWSKQHLVFIMHKAVVGSCNLLQDMHEADQLPCLLDVMLLCLQGESFLKAKDSAARLVLSATDAPVVDPAECSSDAGSETTAVNECTPFTCRTAYFLG